MHITNIRIKLNWRAKQKQFDIFLVGIDFFVIFLNSIDWRRLTYF